MTKEALKLAQHWSDCAVHSEPAYPKGKCDCGGIVAAADYTALSDKYVALSDKYVALSDKYVALKAQHKEQEPVALPCCGYTDASAVKWNPFNNVVQCHNCGQVYTTPPQRTWVDLPHEDILDLFDEHNVYGSKWLEFARAVLAKSKEKNT